MGTGEVRYTRLEYLTLDKVPLEILRSGDGVVLRFHYQAKNEVRHPRFGLRLLTEMGTLITETSTSLHRISISKLKPGEGYIDLEIDSLNLTPGKYNFSLWITGMDGTPVYDGDVRAVLEIDVADVYHCGHTLSSRYGIAYFPQRWGIPETEGAGRRAIAAKSED